MLNVLGLQKIYFKFKKREYYDECYIVFVVSSEKNVLHIFKVQNIMLDILTHNDIVILAN